MASFEQDLIIFEDDTLMLQYTFTDLEGTFNSSYEAWWGAVSSSYFHPDTGNPPATITPALQKKSSGWTDGPGSASPAIPDDITVVTGDTIVRVFFNQDDFVATTTSAPTLETNTEYYTELVLSTNGSEATSVVAATGKLYVSASLFSAAEYRPV